LVASERSVSPLPIVILTLRVVFWVVIASVK
jgi:hypothetical protein